MSASPAPKGLKIGEVARRSGVGVETLRFYESLGLVAPACRTAAGYRIYDSSVFDRLSFIKKAQSAGFTLDEISRIVQEAAGGRRPCHEVRQLAARRLAGLDRRIAELERYRAELAETLRAWDRAGGKGRLICGLIEGLEPGQISAPQAGPLSSRSEA